MFLDNEVVGVTVKFFEGELGGVSVVDFVNGSGEVGPDFFGAGSVNVGSCSEGLDNYFLSRIYHCEDFLYIVV